MAKEIDVRLLAEEFIQTYLKEIRHLSSLFSYRDWGFLPIYWFHPVKIEIFHTESDDIAIKLGDIAKAKKDLIKIVEIRFRLEDSQFPNLNYNEFPFFRISNETHHFRFKGGTLSVGTHPVVILGHGVDFKIMDVRVEANVAGYPRERKFIWFFTNPNLANLQNRYRAIEEAKSDFWGAISSIVFSRTNDIFSRNLSAEIIDLFLDSLHRLQNEYHSLITQNDIEEQRLQNILENHFFLLDPNKSFTKEKRTIGKYYADFVIKYDDGNLTLVEIQLNHDSIIEKGQPSKGFKEALQQLEEWFIWLEENDPDAFSRCRGLIIIGRQQDYEMNRAEIDKKLASLVRPSALRTYDDLENAFSKIIDQLQKMKLTK